MDKKAIRATGLTGKMEDSRETFLDTARKLKQSSKVVAKPILEKLVLLSLETGEYYTLNKSGREIWDYCSEPRAAQEIVDYVCSKYDLGLGGTEEEIRGYLGALGKEKLLEMARE